jgi:tetratricopeptide (TPR) repeat protein
LSQNLLEVNSSNAEALMLLAWARFMTGEHELAPELIRRAIEIAPNEPYTHYYDALLKVRRGDFPAATDAIRVAIDRGYSPDMLAAEPFLNELRHFPEFEKLLARSAGSK